MLEYSQPTYSIRTGMSNAPSRKGKLRWPLQESPTFSDSNTRTPVLYKFAVPKRRKKNSLPNSVHSPTQTAAATIATVVSVTTTPIPFVGFA